MRYTDVLNEQKMRLEPDLKWWPSFFYHFTDVHNVVNILKIGWIMSREDALAAGMMIKDNASRAVINATSYENKRYGRLYFRPLTPTQYHSEGYKPEKVRNLNINASCPVPVFLCLDAASTLEYPGTKFAEKGLAGGRHNLQEGVDNFARLNFEKIYHDGWYELQDSDIKDYRDSEIIREGGFPVEPLLRCILCRTIAEKETLLYLIQNYSMRMYNSYLDRILYQPKVKCFNYNGIFIKNVVLADGCVRLELNDPEQRNRNCVDEVYFSILIELEYIREDGGVILAESGGNEFNYGKVRSVMMQLKHGLQYRFLRVRVLFDNEIMYENVLDTWGSQLF